MFEKKTYGRSLPNHKKKPRFYLKNQLRKLICQNIYGVQRIKGSVFFEIIGKKFFFDPFSDRHYLIVSQHEPSTGIQILGFAIRYQREQNKRPRSKSTKRYSFIHFI